MVMKTVTEIKAAVHNNDQSQLGEGGGGGRETNAVPALAASC